MYYLVYYNNKFTIKPEYIWNIFKRKTISKKSSKNYFNVTPTIYEFILRDILTKTQKKAKNYKRTKNFKIEKSYKKNFYSDIIKWHLCNMVTGKIYNVIISIFYFSWVVFSNVTYIQLPLYNIDLFTVFEYVISINSYQHISCQYLFKIMYNMHCAPIMRMSQFWVISHYA